MGGGSGVQAGGGGGMAEGEYSTEKTSVWWDIENCQVPRVCDPHMIAQNISSALSSMGYRGPVFISSYGDTSKISQSVQHALSSTGISLNHVPAGVKDASDKKILVDMLFWAVDNPPPANYLLISGDRDFSNALHQLRMRRYNILLAQPPNVSQALVAAAKSVWHWKDLVVGGPPISESPYLSNTISGTVPSIESSKMISNTDQSSTHLENQKFSANGKLDNRHKWKQVNRFPNQGQAHSNSPITSKDEFKQPCGSQGPVADNGIFHTEHVIEQPNQVYFSTTPNSSQESSHSNCGTSFSQYSSPQRPYIGAGYPYQTETTVIREAPHEFFRADKPETLTGPLPGHGASLSDFPVKNGKHFSNSHKPQYSQPLRPSDLLPPQPSSASGNFSSSNSQRNSSYAPQTRPNDPPFFSPQNWPGGSPFPLAPSGNLPDIGGININDYPSSDQDSIPFYQQAPRPTRNSHPESPSIQHNGKNLYHDHKRRLVPASAIDSTMPTNVMCVPGCTTPPPEVQVLVGIIVHALQILKADKMAPTEVHIADCIRYGEMNIQNFNVKMALDSAIQHQVVVMHKLGGNLPFYIGKNDALWNCVNLIDSSSKHPKATWDAIFNFLSSPFGRSSILTSQCRYQAATILKRACLKHLVMGDILQILHLAISVKKWIKPHSSGWQPLSLNLPAADKDTSAAAGSSM